MDFDKVIEKRKSVRSFKNKVVNWKDIVYVVEAATKGPGAGGDLPLKFIIVENPKSIQRLAEAAEQSWIADAGIIIAVVSEDKHLENLYGDKGRIYSRQQAGAAISTILLKLTDLGLAGCWVGSYNDEKVKQVLHVPAGKQVEAIIPIGYENPVPEKKRKKMTFEFYLRWEELGKKKRHPIFIERKSVSDIHGHPQ